MIEAIYTQRELDLARLAAYIDGEGTVDLQLSKEVKRRTARYRLRIIIYNTDLRLLAWCRDTFSGNVRMNRKGTPKYPPLYMWEISGTRYAGGLLKECLPFFVIKREQAEIGIAFGKTFSPSNRDPRGLSETVRQNREALRTKIYEIRRVKPEQPALKAS